MPRIPLSAHVDLFAYATNAFDAVNTTLREAKELHPSMRCVHEALLGAAEEAGDDAPVLWRGCFVSREHLAAGTWTDPAWSSCSRRRDIGEMFAMRRLMRSGWLHPGVPLLLRIEISPSVLAVDMAAHLNAIVGNQRGHFEQEVVLAPGQIWTLVGGAIDPELIEQGKAPGTDIAQPLHVRVEAAASIAPALAQPAMLAA
jgi:hypothetical protein